MMNRWRVMKRLLPLAAGMILLLSACGREDLSTLNPQGPVAQKQFDLMTLSISIMALVVVVVFAICIYVLIRFRRRKGDKTVPKQVEGNHTLEIIWTVVPIILLLILGVPTINTVFGLSKDYSKDPKALQVTVTSHQYWWEFEYPEYGIKTGQELVVPTGKKIQFKLASADVTHAFWIPSIGGKIDTNAGTGTTNKLYLEFPKEGVFRGKCAELCGPSHSLMDFKAKAVSQASFDRWVAAMKAPAVMPEDSKIKEAFENKCLTCHAVGENNAGSSAPNLTGIGSRQTIAGILYNDEKSTEENIKEWVTDTQKVKPGNMMPSAKDLDLTQEELDGIAKYLADYKLDY
ncbi:cytochrome c oxidase subunit II [Cohnella nanjingensis]|uniref:Cytochrome c oxidase subunit 2 n=1 Tax=Cohnella nanjingensis TaxID=1387779 RepID=A0A7X0RVP8_9BACL|nr:cytochrome c oxidase subunit II [Cohnella nanjingensis]MBB6674466.1 cytochrome c oxidase subunit II [Cohnella nanjingensis]